MKYVKKYNSIHLHLLYHYAFAIMIVLTLIGAALYWEAVNVIDQADYEFITDELNNLQFILADNTVNKKLLKETVIESPVKTHDSLYRYYIRVLDDKNKLLIETPGMTNIISLPESTEQRFILKEQKYFWDAHDGHRFIMLQTPVKLKGYAGAGMVQILLDTTYQHSLTQDKKIFFFILFAGAILSLLIGILVTRRGLRSLDSLTETVRNITTSSLGKRVNPATLPTELMGLGRAFNEMLDDIEASFARLKQMSADMSHELRTPIMNLTGQTELLLSYEYSKEDYRAALASNLEELQRMSSIIENILFLARAANPQTALLKQYIHINDEIRKICDYYQPMADEKKITVMCDGHAEVKVDIVMFRRLMSNIISNALKYTRDNGRIIVTISEDSRYATIMVADTGIGIDKENIPKLFDRFYRVDASRSTGIRGSGLGLAIAKSIVDLHHGNIVISSTTGVGTNVCVTLPK